MIRKGKLIFSKNKPFDRLTNLRGNAEWGHVSSLRKTEWDFDDVNKVLINKFFKKHQFGAWKEGSLNQSTSCASMKTYVWLSRHRLKIWVSLGMPITSNVEGEKGKKGKEGCWLSAAFQVQLEISSQRYKMVTDTWWISLESSWTDTYEHTCLYTA